MQDVREMRKMERWRQITWSGIILGNGIAAIDAWGASIPYEIIIPIEIMSLILIFSGLINRRREKMQKRNAFYP